MSIHLVLLLAFVTLLVLSLAHVLPMAWTAVCIAYLATVQAVNVLLTLKR